MTEKIDLDEIDLDDDDADPESPVGDPIWSSDDREADSRANDSNTEPGDAGDEAADADSEPADAATEQAHPTTESTDAATESDDPGSSPEADGRHARIPHVPHSDMGKPAGIPMESGGSGGGSGGSEPDEGAAGADPPEATGPHGETADDLTLAFTYRAMRRVADPAYVFSDASAWADWLGIVGDVPTAAINKFQREHTVDADFFTGAASGPRERLQNIDEHSMFYAERFVLVGCADDEVDESAWAPDGWEFVPLEVAAEEAGWERR